VALESHQAIDSKAVEMHLHAGDKIEAKIVKLNPSSCIVNLKLHIHKDDAKLYLAENKILSRYGLVDSKSFKVVHEEDFPFTAVSLDHLKKSSQVKYSRSTKNRHFRNWNVFECRKELESNSEIDVVASLPSISSGRSVPLPFSCFGGSTMD
jgi:hypothetical protein